MKRDIQWTYILAVGSTILLAVGTWVIGREMELW